MNRKLRRVILIVLSLAVMFAVAAVTNALYRNHDEVISIEDMDSKEKVLSSDGTFTGKFRCELPAKYLSDYKYEVEDNNLYITFYAATNEERCLPVDEDGYAEISIETGEDDIKKIYAVKSIEETKIDFEKE